MNTTKPPSFAETLNKLQRDGYHLQRTEAAKLDAEQQERDKVRNYKKEVLREFGAPLSGADERIEDFCRAGLSVKEAVAKLRHPT